MEEKGKKLYKLTVTETNHCHLFGAVGGSVATAVIGPAVVALIIHPRVVTSTVTSMRLLLGRATEVYCHTQYGVCPVVLCDSPAGLLRSLHTSSINVFGERKKKTSGSGYLT
ncbi:unnamed protein product [Arctogadus glacialis]